MSPIDEKRETAAWRKNDRIKDGRPAIAIWKTHALKALTVAVEYNLEVSAARLCAGYAER
ncbi:hypothetical protein [Bradyrhizobium sp. LMTR 3]|uniref:hypothetical protein n=1 Tax=Bradyrhizobium sp. LMTR 3 TaxID=189873 RepID=UPI001146A1EE|nr:hypothetical protein [Bradyrhizobium sp. LMTR 3]